MKPIPLPRITSSAHRRAGGLPLAALLVALAAPIPVLAAGACKARQLAPVGSKALEIGFEVRMVRAKRRLSPAAESFWQTVDPG